MAIPKTHEGDIFNRALSRVGDSRLVFEAEKTVTGITAANPPVVSVAAHGYANGDRVLLYDLTGAAELNGRVFEIGSVAAGTFALYRETGSGYSAATAGFCRKLPAIKAARTAFDAWARIRDEIIRAHPWNSVVRRARLYRGDAARTVTAVTIRAITAIGNTTPVTITAASHGLTNGDTVYISGTLAPSLNNRSFVVTGVAGADFQLAGTNALGALGAGGVSTRSPVIITTSAAHGLSPGDLILIADMIGAAEFNERWFSVASVPSTTTFTIAIDPADYVVAWTSGGSVYRSLPPLKPDFGYAYKYTLPEDCERVLELAEDPDYGWETEGRQLVTDLGPTVPIRYARKITDPDQFDAQLTTVLVARLASEIAEELTQSNTKKEALRKDFEDLISEAKRLDAQEQSGQDFAPDSWELARL